jgi:hypothetical protein
MITTMSPQIHQEQKQEKSDSSSPSFLLKTELALLLGLKIRPISSLTQHDMMSKNGMSLLLWHAPMSGLVLKI